MSDTPQLLRSAGLRSTVARNAVIAALQTLGGHRSVDELGDWIERELALGALSPSTLYRTLETLEGVGLVGAIRLPSATVTFEWVGGVAHAHSHLICDRCGADQVLPAELLEPLGRSIERRTAFRPALAHLALRGECEDCRQG